MATRLAKLLEQRPDWRLASFTAESATLGNGPGVAPILMRYALLGNSECIDALERMGEPRVGLAIIANAYEFDESVRERLRALLGEEAGETRQEWAELYDARYDHLPSPFPASTLAETERVIDCVVSYWAARNQHDAAVSALAQRMAYEGGHRPRGQYVDAARRRLHVADPNWDVPTTAELEEEVQAYADRVQRAAGME